MYYNYYWKIVQTYHSLLFHYAHLIAYLSVISPPSITHHYHYHYPLLLLSSSLTPSIITSIIIIVITIHFNIWYIVSFLSKRNYSLNYKWYLEYSIRLLVIPPIIFHILVGYIMRKIQLSVHLSFHLQNFHNFPLFYLTFFGITYILIAY